MQSKNGKKDIYVFYSREHGLDFFANYSKTVIAMTVRLVAINMFFLQRTVPLNYTRKGVELCSFVEVKVKWKKERGRHLGRTTI